jgi:hypothetical protein
MADKLEDRVAKLVADAKAGAQDCLEQAERMAGFARTPRRAMGPPPPPVPNLRPDYTGSALAYDQACKLAAAMLVRGCSQGAYLRMRGEQTEVVVTEIHELVRLGDDVYAEIGMRLSILKEHKPKDVRWGQHLKDLGIRWGSRRADEYISVFRREITALDLKKKTAERVRKYKAKRALGNAQPSVDSKGKSETPPSGGSLSPSSGSIGSACAINWENHREEPGEPDRVVRKRALEWQLHEATRLAEEFALRRPGTHFTEVTDAVLRKIAKVIVAWKKLQKEMQTAHIGGNHAR